MSIIKISEHLFLFEDICNVYIVKNEKSGLLINSGKGRVINGIDRIGVEKIDWILHTHHHRDLCQGDHLLTKMGAKVAVPSSELKFFNMKGFWEEFDIFSNYSFNNIIDKPGSSISIPFPITFTPRENIPVDTELDSSTDFSWLNFRFQIVETPGPTLGSISLISDIDGVKVAFTGDLIHSPGKVWNLYSLQRHHNDACREAVEDTLRSLDIVNSQKVEVLLPSHGVPIRDVSYAISKLRMNLHNVVKVLGFKEKVENNGWRLLPHLYYKNTSYFIVSRSGKVMVYDYFDAKEDQDRWVSQRDLNRVMHEVENFKCFDVGLPSHYHDDHSGGLDKLRKKYGTKIWAYENMVDILENPSNYKLIGLYNKPIKVDRVLRDGETFQWEEYTFTVYHFPGQTEYHMAMYGVIDGKKVLFVGDSALTPSTIFRAAGINGLNYCRLEANEGVMKCAKIMLRLKPDYVLPSHRGMVTITEKRLQEYLSWANDLNHILAEATAQPDVNMSWDPNWVSLYPYQQKAKPREKIEVMVNVRNHMRKNAEATVNLELPDGWEYSPSKTTEIIPAKSVESFKFHISIPSNVDSGRTVITANIIFDGKDWGELAEAIIEVPS